MCESTFLGNLTKRIQIMWSFWPYDLILTHKSSAEPRLESFYAPFVAGIDLPHQGVVDSNILNEITFSKRE